MGGLVVFAASGLAIDWSKHPPLPVLIEIGRTAIGDAGWVLPSLLGVILAFYAALIGQSLTRTNRDAMTYTRNRLGLAGQLISAVVVVYLALAVVTCVSEQSKFPHLLGILALGTITVLLGAGAGTFVLGTFEEQIQVARASRSRRQSKLDHMNPAPSMTLARAVTTTVVTVLVLSLGPPLILLPFYLAGLVQMDWITFSVVNVVVCLGAVPVVALTTVGIIDNRGNPVRTTVLYIYLFVNWAILAAVTASISVVGPTELMAFQWVTTLSLSILVLSAVLALHLRARPWMTWTLGAVLMRTMHSGLTWFVNRGDERIRSLQLAKRAEDAAEADARGEGSDPGDGVNSDWAKRLTRWSATGA